MDNDLLMFAAIFIVAISVMCCGVFLVMLNRIGGSPRARLRKRKTGYRAAIAHRAFKDVM